MKELGRKIKFMNRGVHLSVQFEVSVFYTQGNTKRKSGMPEAYTQATTLCKVYAFLMAPFMRNWKDVCSNMSFPQNIWTG